MSRIATAFSGLQGDPRNESHHTPRSDRIRRRSGHESPIVPRGSRDRIHRDQDRQRRVHLWRDRGKRRATFEGRQYSLGIGGISAGATIGASGADLVGTAYHLHQPSDIEGIYSAVGAGLAVAGGRKAAAELTNARGVLLKLRGRQMGLMFSLDLSGVQISLR